MKSRLMIFGEFVAPPLFLLIFGLIFRLNYQNLIPMGFQWDEASYAYNAYSLMTTGKDEWGRNWPLFLEAFGDFKPALLSYLMIFSFSLFGISELSARLPVILLSVVGSLAFYGLIVTLSKNKLLSFTASFLLLTSPWHMHYSRIAFDPMFSLSFMLIGLWGYVQKKIFWRWLGVFFLILSMYTYANTKLVVPFLAISYEWLFNYRTIEKIKFNTKTIFHKDLFAKFKSLLPLLSILLFSFILILMSALTVAGERARTVFFWDAITAQTSIEESMHRHLQLGLPTVRVFSNKIVYFFQSFSSQYLSHFNPFHLSFGNNDTPAFAFSNHGLLLILSIPLIFIGLLSKRNNFWWFFFIWLILSPLPASLSQNAPNANRALIMLPAWLTFAGLGVMSTVNFLHEKFKRFISFRFLKLVIWLAILMTVFLNFIWYFRDLLLFFPEQSSQYFHSVYKDGSPYIWRERENYDQVFISDRDTQVYIFLSWYNLIDPQTVRNFNQTRKPLIGLTQMENINIVPLNSDNAQCYLGSNNNALVITTKEEMIQSLEPLKVFYRFDRFKQPELGLAVYNSAQLLTNLQKLDFASKCDPATFERIKSEILENDKTN